MKKTDLEVIGTAGYNGRKYNLIYEKAQEKQVGLELSLMKEDKIEVLV